MILSLVLLVGGSISAQIPPKGYKSTESGFHYRIHTKNDEGRKAQPGDMVTLNLQLSTAFDSVVFSTYTLGDNPIDYRIQEPKFNGDIMEGFAMLHGGDSATFYLRADSLYRQFRPEFATAGLWMRYDIKVYKVLSPEDYQSQQETERGERIAGDLAIIDSVLDKRGISAHRKGDLFIHWHKKTNGKQPERGADVWVHYNGRLLDGKPFDSSVERDEPFNLKVGAGQVIEGWELALPYLHEGDSATVYLPSSLGYGARGAGHAIPPHAILVFDIHLIDVYNFQVRLEQDMARIKAEVDKRGVPVQRSKRGVFYYQTKTGGGTQPDTGKEVAIRYSMKNLSGEELKNTGSEPVSFTLGEEEIIEGIEDVVVNLRVGSRAVLFIPSPLGYGRMASNVVPSNTILEVELEVIGVD